MVCCSTRNLLTSVSTLLAHAAAFEVTRWDDWSRTNTWQRASRQQHWARLLSPQKPDCARVIDQPPHAPERARHDKVPPTALAMTGATATHLHLANWNLCGAVGIVATQTQTPPQLGTVDINKLSSINFPLHVPKLVFIRSNLVAAAWCRDTKTAEHRWASGWTHI